MEATNIKRNKTADILRGITVLLTTAVTFFAQKNKVLNTILFSKSK